MAKARKKREDDIKSGVCVACGPCPEKQKQSEVGGQEETTTPGKQEMQYKPENSLPYERHDMQDEQLQRLNASGSVSEGIMAPSNLEVLRPLQRGIPRPDPNLMPELYAAAPFGPLTWEQPPVKGGSYGGNNLLQTQFQQFAQNQSYSQPHQHMQAQVISQSQQQQQPGQMPWLMEAPLADLDVSMNANGIEVGELGGGPEDFNWEGIDDLVRDIQMQTNSDQIGAGDGGG